MIHMNSKVVLMVTQILWYDVMQMQVYVCILHGTGIVIQFIIVCV